MKNRPNEEKLYETASNQGGYFTTKQGRDAGYGYRLQSYHRLRGHWTAVDRGIFRLRRHPHSLREDLIRLSLWSFNRKGKPQIVFSHQTALSFHEIGDFMPGKIHFTVSPRFRKKIPAGCVVHRGMPGDFEAHSGFLVTMPLRSVVDCIEADIEPGQVAQSLLDAMKRGMIRIPDLRSKALSPKAKAFLEEQDIWNRVNNG
jgi:hypothetical protein